jgi:hypothetical protein
MINLFRHSNPISLVLLVLLACFPHFLFPYTEIKNEITKDPSIFSIQFNELFGDFFIKKTFWNSLASTLIILIEAFGLNKIFSNLRLFEKSGFVPSLCFVLLTNLIPYPYQGQMLLVNGALLLSLHYIITSFKKEKANGTILLAGFYAGIAAGFNNNFIIFIWLTFALFAMRPASLREWILSAIGFALPFYFMFSILYLNNKIDSSTILEFPTFNASIPTLSNITWLRYFSFIGIAMIGVFASIQSMRKLLIQARKTLVVTYQLFFIIVISCLFSLQQSPYNLYLLTIPASILIISIFITYKRLLIPNLVIVLLIILSTLR